MARAAKPSTLRLVAGKWRGRKIEFFEAEGLRPTSDRIRETLFNWLQDSIRGAHCLDLFSGSGALGLEAASRGAEMVVMVESNPATVRQLQTQVARLGAEEVTIWQGSALDYLAHLDHRFDLLFLDPPFNSHLLDSTLSMLGDSDSLKPQSRIYIEFPRRNPPQLPSGWQFEKLKTAGEVGYGLAAADA